MKSRCPQCGGWGQGGAFAISSVSVWFSCMSCHSVWRSSLIETALNSVVRVSGLKGIYRKAVQGYKPLKEMPSKAVVTMCREAAVDAQPQPCDPEISGELDHLERALAASGRGIGPSASWLLDNDDNNDEQDASPMRAAADGRRAPVVEARAAVLEVEVAEVDNDESPLSSSVGRTLKNVDGMCDAFASMQKQLAGLEKWCDTLIDGRSENGGRSSRRPEQVPIQPYRIIQPF
jgi:hypothetical protein